MDITPLRSPPTGRPRLNITCTVSLGTIITITGTSVMTITAVTMTVVTNISTQKDMCLVITIMLPCTIAMPLFGRLSPVTLVTNLQN